MTHRKPTAALEDAPLFHPLLLAVCPILGLYAYNAGAVPWTVLIRPILAALVVAEILVIAFWIGLRDKHKGGLAASLVLLALMWGWSLLESCISTAFPYVQALNPVIVYSVAGGAVVLLSGAIFALNRGNPRRAFVVTCVFLALVICVALVVVVFLDRVFGAVASTFIVTYLGLLTAAIVYLARMERDFKPWTRTANWFGVMLVGLYVALIFFHMPREEHLVPPQLDIAHQDAPEKDALPDIYLFVVEGYARCDVLLKRYSYNDLPVLESLQDMGMTFVPKAFSNYAWDMPSAASLLNMEYLDRLLPSESDAAEPVPLRALYHHNRFFQVLGDHGYEIAAYSPGVQALEAGPLVDRTLSPPRTPTEFEAVLLNNMITRRCLEMVYFVKGRDPRAWFRGFHRARIQYVFDTVGDVAAEAHTSPRLVFAHLTIPDMPFLFGRKGGWVDFRSGGDIDGLYLDQLHYTSQMLTAAIERICQKATRPSIIVVASSHGPGMHGGEESTEAAVLAERFGILLGLRYPDTENDVQLPDETGESLVNILRSVLNRALDVNVPLLEDQAYLTPLDSPLEGQAVTVPMLETAVAPALEAP